MKSDVVIAEEFMHDAGENVFAGMLLHEIEAPLPAYDAVHRGSNGYRLLRDMHDHVVAAPCVCNGSSVQCAGIAGLAAALGIKCGLRQCYFESGFSFRTSGDHSVKFFQISVFIIQFSVFIHD